MTPARSSILTAAGRASTSSECPSRAVTVITAINVTVHTSPAGTSASKRRPHRKTSTGPRPPTRRQRITAIITSQPPRDWSGHELAVLLDVKPRHMLTQLREWALLGFFTRTGYGTYRLNTPPAGTSSTTGPTLNYAALRRCAMAAPA